MIRETLSPGSRNAFIFLGGSHQIGFDLRKIGFLETEAAYFSKPFELTEAVTLSLYPEEFVAGELRLRKVDNELTAFVKANNKDDWVFIYSSDQVDYESFFVGIAVSSQASSSSLLRVSSPVSEECSL